MDIQKAMSCPPRTCRAADSLEVAAELLRQYGVSVLPVVDTDGRLVGMITERRMRATADRCKRALSELTAKDVADRGVSACRTTDGLRVAHRLLRHSESTLPVVDDDRRVVGVLSERDLP